MSVLLNAEVYQPQVDKLRLDCRFERSLFSTSVSEKDSALGVGTGKEVSDRLAWPTRGL